MIIKIMTTAFMTFGHYAKQCKADEQTMILIFDEVNNPWNINQF